jgi:hypothetical protein
MWRTNFLRCKQSCRNAITHFEKFLSNVSVSKSQVIRDVFEETEAGSAFPNDPSDSWPEVSWVFLCELLACNREWLARVAANDSIHKATPWLAVEGLNI